MKPVVRVDKTTTGLHIYLLDPADAGQAIYDVSGCSNPLTLRDQRELEWAAERCGMKPRDVIAATRAAIKATR